MHPTPSPRGEVGSCIRFQVVARVAILAESVRGWGNATKHRLQFWALYRHYAERERAWRGAVFGCALLLILAAVAAAQAAAPARGTLVVTVRGQGKITSTPRGVLCPRVCRVSFRKGARVRLRAVPATGWKFDEWAGACIGAGRCALTLKTRTAVRGTFERDPLAGSTAVRFQASDGVKLEGRVFGTGTTGIVLAHGNDEGGQGTWFDFAPVLAKSGYRVLTFDFGGFCPGGSYGCSGGPRNLTDTWLDVAAATQYLQAQGVTKVFLIGASLGAHSVLWGASRPGFDVAGVVAISGPQNALGGPELHYDLTPDVLQQIQERKLFMAGTQDVEEGYSPAADAKAMYAASNEPKQLALLDTTAHGAAMLAAGTPTGDEAIGQVLAFIAAH